MHKRNYYIAITAIMLLVGLLLIRQAEKPVKPAPIPGVTRSADTLSELQMTLQTIAARQAANDTKPDYSKIWGAFTAFLVALFAGIKVIADLSNKPLELRLEAIATDSKAQFTRIFSTLDVMEDSLVRRAVTDELRAIVRGYIHFNQSLDERTRMLIDSQCERLISFSEEVMEEKYNMENWEQTEAKMEIQSRAGRTQVRELFGDEFLEQYKVMQTNAVSDFRENLSIIFMDNVVNSKYARFKNAAETFLHQLIKDTLALTHKWNKHEKLAHRHAG